MSVVTKIIEIGQAMIAWLVGGTVGSGSDAITIPTGGAIGTFVNFIVENEFIMFFVVVAFVTMAISVLKRLKNI